MVGREIKMIELKKELTRISAVQAAATDYTDTLYGGGCRTVLVKFFKVYFLALENRGLFFFLEYTVFGVACCARSFIRNDPGMLFEDPQ